MRPNPLRARADRSRAFYDGCLVGISGTNSNKCLYGDPHGKHTLILFGDSHAMQYFPALEELAKQRDWRLITLTKAECTPGEVKIRSMVADREYSQCDAWREDALQRIEAGDPKSAVVVISGDTAYTPYDSAGEELSGNAAAAAMEAGYVREPRPDPQRRPAHGRDQGHARPRPATSPAASPKTSSTSTPAPSRASATGPRNSTPAPPGPSPAPT